MSQRSDRLAELIHDHAEAGIQLRAAQAQLELARAEAEQRAIEVAGGPKSLGANAEDRARALTLALSQDQAYRAAAKKVEDLQAWRDRLRADLDVLHAERVDREIAVREALIDVLRELGRSVSSHSGNSQLETAVLDAIIDRLGTRALERIAEAQAREAPADFPPKNPFNVTVVPLGTPSNRRDVEQAFDDLPF